MKFALLAAALAATVATVPATSSAPPALPIPAIGAAPASARPAAPASSPASVPAPATIEVPATQPDASIASASASASASDSDANLNSDANSDSNVNSSLSSATDREVARLAQLAADDAARQSREPSIRSAPGRESIETGGLRRCVDAAGSSVFTDRACDSINAIDAPIVAPPAPIGPRVIAVRSCARSQEDLLDGVRNALEIHDVNRLADYYHWTGMDGAEGYRLMDRLDAFSKRPFVDARLVSSRAPPVVDAELGSPGLLSRGMDPAASEPSAPRLPPARAADLLRVDQMRSDRDAAAEVTWFRLRPNAGCWWMQY